MFKSETEIQLTENGDFLLSSKEARDYYHPPIIGYHKYCETYMNLTHTSKQKNTIYCQKCNFRIEIPLEIDNFEKIEKYFKKKFEIPIDKIENRSEILDL